MAKTSASRVGPDQSSPELKELLKNRRSDLSWYHQAGRLVAQLVSERNYGRGEMRKLAKRLGESENFENELYAWRKFAIEYRTADLRALKGLNFARVQALLSATDPNFRLSLQQKALTEGWSSRDIRRKIQERQGKRSSGGGRPKIPKRTGPRTALQETVRLSKGWLRSCPRALASASTKLRRKLGGQDRDQFEQLVKEALDVLQQLESGAKKARAQLQPLVKRSRTGQ